MRLAPALVCLTALACEPTPSSTSAEVSARDQDAAVASSAAPGYDPSWRRQTRPATPESRDADDPLGGPIDLRRATEGLAGDGPLLAELDTTLGTLHCTLMPDRAPRTVAQFVGLARGKRPYRSRRGWVAEPAYDGTRFSRVVPGLLVAGGRPLDVHPEGIGIAVPPERWPGMRHDEPGLLCSAARGAHGAGELLITAGDASRLDPPDGGNGPALTVFGRCEPDDLALRLSQVPSERGRPREALVLRRIRITRGSASASPSVSASTTSRPAPPEGPRPAK